MLFVSRGDGPEVLEFVEEALDDVAISIEEAAESGDMNAVRHRLDVRPCAAFVKGLAHPVAVISAVGEQNLTVAEIIQHVVGAPAVMRLAFGELELHRQAVGVNESMDLCCQSAARTPHASGSNDIHTGGAGGLRTPFLAFAPC